MVKEVPYNVLGLVFGIAGLLGLIPIANAAIRHRFPRHKLKQLDDALDETTALLDSAIKDGFVPGAHFVMIVQGRLEHLKKMTESLRSTVMCANGFFKQLLGSFNGLSSCVDTVLDDVSLLRTRIASVSDSERRKAESGGGSRELIDDRLPFNSSLDGLDSLDPWRTTDNGADSRDFLVCDEKETATLLNSLAPQLPTIAMPSPMYYSQSPCFKYQTIYRPIVPDLEGSPPFKSCLHSDGQSSWSLSASPKGLPVLGSPLITSSWSTVRNVPLPVHVSPAEAVDVSSDALTDSAVRPNMTFGAPEASSVGVNGAEDLVAQLKEELLEELQNSLASVVQAALESTLQGIRTSRARASARDIESAS